MSRIHSPSLILITLAAAVLWAAPGGAQIVALETELGFSDLEYDADIRFEDGETVATGHIYRVPGRERWELAVDGATVVSILRSSTDVIWLLVPDLRIYSTTLLDDPLVEAFMPLPAGDRSVKLELEGPALVAGVASTRYGVLGVDAAGELYEGLLWISDDGVVLRAAAADDGRPRGPSIELSNVRIRPQAPAFFTVPKGFSQAQITRQTIASVGSGSPQGRETTTRVSGGRDVVRVEDESGVVEVDREIIDEGISLLGGLLGRAKKAVEGDRDQVLCKPGRVCRVGSHARAALVCEGSGCEMVCGSSSNCTFDCPGGDCAITCGSTSKCEIDCPRGCDMTCGSLAHCSSEW